MSDNIPTHENHSIFYGKTHGFKTRLPCETPTRYKYHNTFNEFPVHVKGYNEQNECNNQLCQNHWKGVPGCLNVSSVKELEQLSATLIQSLNEDRNNCDMKEKYLSCDNNKPKSWQGSTVQSEHDPSIYQSTNDPLCPEQERNKVHSIPADRKNSKQIPDSVGYLNYIRKRKAQTPLISKAFIKAPKFKRDLHSNLSTPSNASSKIADKWCPSLTINATASSLQKKPEVSSKTLSDHGTHWTCSITSPRFSTNDILFANKKRNLLLENDGLSKLGNLLPECPKRPSTDRVNLQVLQDKMDDTDRSINLFEERIQHLADRVQTYIPSNISCDRHKRKMNYTEVYTKEENQKSEDNLMTSRIIESSRSDMSELPQILETCNDPATTYSVDLLSDIGNDSMSCYL